MCIILVHAQQTHVEHVDTLGKQEKGDGESEQKFIAWCQEEIVEVGIESDFCLGLFAATAGLHRSFLLPWLLCPLGRQPIQTMLDGSLILIIQVLLAEFLHFSQEISWLATADYASIFH